jgi:hypothetical protein
MFNTSLRAGVSIGSGAASSSTFDGDYGEPQGGHTWPSSSTMPPSDAYPAVEHNVGESALSKMSVMHETLA